MKRNSVIILVIFILFVSAVYLAFRIDSPKRPVVAKTDRLPKLYVNGRYIKRADTNEPVILKGVTTMAFAYYTPDNNMMEILDIAKGWGINLLGLYIDPSNMGDRANKLTYVIDWAEKNNIYVHLIPVDKDNDFIDQIDKYPQFMGKLAEKYRKRNNIIYGLAAEPNLEWSKWRNYAGLVADAIIKSKPDAVIVMTGVYFSREIDFKDKLPYKNVIYDFHEYPASRKEPLAEILEKKKYKFLWEPEHENYPVIVGEFGGVWLTDFGSDEDLEFIQKVIDNVNKNGLSYMAYTVDQEGELGLIDNRYKTLTRKGELIKKDLADHPPTDFR